ncbi:MAG: hypothetical protein ABIH87_03310 [bacterium]
MLSLIETILVKIFSLLPEADPNNSVITAVNNAFATMTPTLAKIDLIFPLFSLFKILLLVLFVEMTLFLITLVLKMVTFLKP